MTNEELTLLVQKQRTVITDLMNALDDYSEWHGEAHEIGCSQDDTCECKARPINDKLNAAYAEAMKYRSRV